MFEAYLHPSGGLFTSLWHTKKDPEKYDHIMNQTNVIRLVMHDDHRYRSHGYQKIHDWGGHVRITVNDVYKFCNDIKIELEKEPDAWNKFLKRHIYKSPN